MTALNSPVSALAAAPVSASAAIAGSAVHPVDEKIPLPRSTALGLQHVLLMYAGAIAVPLIVGRALKLTAE